MAKSPVQYAVIDAFTAIPFKGNPAAVCLLEDERDDEWLQSVAREFNFSQTAYLTRSASTGTENGDASIKEANPRFHLRWFTPCAEVDLCGHATLAAAHFIFTLGSVRTSVIEFMTRSGILTAKRMDGGNEKEQFSIELDFPAISVFECEPGDVPSIPKTLNGASVVDIKKTSNDILVVLSSGRAVVELQPHFDEIQGCAGRGVIITGLAPPESGFDFYTRFFCPKLGINEDPVCGSAHCALVNYWSKKLGKNDFIAYQASPRGGKLDLHLEQTQRVRIRGEAVTVMVGSLMGVMG